MKFFKNKHKTQYRTPTRTVLIEKELDEWDKPELDFTGIGIFEEARNRKICGYGYNASRIFTVWQTKSKQNTWNRLCFRYGIRNTSMMQYYPIWNMSNNSERALLFGIRKLYFQIVYYRSGSFNQNRRYPFRENRWLWKFYQLFF